MNVYRTLAADYSELAYIQARMRARCLEAALNKKLPFKVRKNSIRQAKYHHKEVIAYAEQVEHHLEEAFVLERPTFKEYQKKFWENNKALAATELGQDGQFDELPYFEYERLYGPIDKHAESE